MENNDNLQDKIDDYLLCRMTKEERLAFEKEISNNKYLRQDVELQKMIKDEISQRVSVFKIMEEAEQESPKGILKLLHNKLFYSVAASIAIIGTFFMWQPTQLSNNQIIEQYAMAKPAQNDILNVETDGLRSANRTSSEINEKMTSAIEHYKNEEYPEAVKCFSVAIDSTSSRSFILYYVISLIKSEKYCQAQKYLELVLKDNLLGQTDYVKYTEALLKIQFGERKEAIKILKGLEHNSSEFSSKAKEVLKKMRWF